MHNKLFKLFLPISVFTFSLFLLMNLGLIDLLRSSKLAFGLLVSGFFTIGTIVFIMLSELKRFKYLNKRYEKILRFISNIEPTIDLKFFMDKVFDFALELTATRFGTICISTNDGNWEFISMKGYNKEFLKDIHFEEECFEHLKCENSEIKVIEDILQSSRIPKHIRKIIKSELKDTPKKSILGIFRHGKEVLGFITIDYMKEKVDFSSETLELLKLLLKISALFISAKKDYERRMIFQKEVIRSMIRIIELKDKYTKGHSERVANISVKIAKRLGLSAEDVDMVHWVGIIHDIGKVGIPDEILNKAMKLTKEEYEIVKKHPTLGEQVINQMSYLKDLAPIVRHHHEKWDGTGYPDGLKGKEIPLLSRILAVADAFDAMTSDRSYRKALSIEEALNEIKKNSGIQFDPEIVDAFLDVLSIYEEENLV